MFFFLFRIIPFFFGLHKQRSTQTFVFFWGGGVACGTVPTKLTSRKPRQRKLMYVISGKEKPQAVTGAQIFNTWEKNWGDVIVSHSYG